MGQRADDRYIVGIIRKYKLLHSPESRDAAVHELLTMAASAHDRARVEACITILDHIDGRDQAPRRRHRRSNTPVKALPVSIVWQEPKRR